MINQRHESIIEQISNLSQIPILCLSGSFRQEGRYFATFNQNSESIEVSFDSNRSDLSFRILFHELAHATGSKDRLNRPTPQFGSKTTNEYIIEEVIAELVQSKLMNELGLETKETAKVSTQVMGMLLYPENRYECFDSNNQFLTLSEEEVLAIATPLAESAYQFILTNWILKLDVAICQ